MMRIVRSIANDRDERQPMILPAAQLDRPGPWQKTLVGLIAIAAACLALMIVLPRNGQAAASTETYLTGIGVPENCVALVCGSASSAKSYDCCTECHVAGGQTQLMAEKSSVVVGSCLGCHTR